MSIITQSQYSEIIESSDSLSSTYFAALRAEAETAFKAKIGDTYYDALLAKIAGNTLTALETEMMAIVRDWAAFYILNSDLLAAKTVQTQQGAKQWDGGGGFAYDAQQTAGFQEKIYMVLVARENSLNGFIKENAATLSTSIDVNVAALEYLNPAGFISARPVNYGRIRRV